MNGIFQMQEELDFAETDQCKPFFLGLSLAKKQFKLGPSSLDCVYNFS
jgi:hypothetical protein